MMTSKRIMRQTERARKRWQRIRFRQVKQAIRSAVIMCQTSTTIDAYDLTDSHLNKLRERGFNVEVICAIGARTDTHWIISWGDKDEKAAF